LTWWDAAGIVGFALIVGGVAWMHVQAGMIVAGVMLLMAAVAAGRNRR
jgi:hypothetical protein